MKAHGTLIPASPDVDSWSPHLLELLEHGYQVLHDQLDQRPADGVFVISEVGEDGPLPPEQHAAVKQLQEQAGPLCLFVAAWMTRAEVLALARQAGVPLRALESEAPTDQVRVVVVAKDEEMAACRIPLAGVTFTSSQKGARA